MGVHDVCEMGDVSELARILEENPDMLEIGDLGKCTPLHICARAQTGKETTAGRIECAKLLIAKGANIEALDMHGDSPLTHAAMCEMNGSKESSGICKILVDAKADLTVQELNFRMTPLHWAAVGGKIQVIKELLKHPDAKEVQTIRDRNG